MYAHESWMPLSRASVFSFLRPLEEEERKDLIEGLKTKWEQARRVRRSTARVRSARSLGDEMVRCQPLIDALNLWTPTVFF